MKKDPLFNLNMPNKRRRLDSGASSDPMNKLTGNVAANLRNYNLDIE